VTQINGNIEKQEVESKEMRYLGLPATKRQKKTANLMKETQFSAKIKTTSSLSEHDRQKTAKS
jgi:hypothetical protein